MPKVVPLYEQVARRIEGQIDAGRFAVGQRIQSIRQMCKEFGVSDVTAKQALRRLVARGIVRTVSGSGAYVRDRGRPEQRREQRKPLVAFIKLGPSPAPIYAHEIDLIQQELSRIGCTMAYHVAPEGHDLPRVFDEARAAEPACVLVFPPHRPDYEQVFRLAPLRRAPIPLLLIETASPRDAYVTGDRVRETRELARYLYDLGHRRFCLATAFYRKVKGFEEALAQWGDRKVTSHVLGETGASEQDARALARQILALNPRPTAVLAASDLSAGVLISSFLARGLRVPEDISVTAFNDDPQFSRLSPVPLTAMRHPGQEVAQEVAAWVAAQLSPDAQRRRRVRRELVGTLIVRDSTAPPPR